MPLIDAPAVTMIHGTLLVAVQLQLLLTVTVVVFEPPGYAIVCDVGATPKLQEGACVTVKVCPAIVSVPVRELVDVLTSMLKLTVPLPDPLAPPVTVIQLTLLAAVQLQPDPAVTVVLPVPPLDAALCDVDERLKLHAAAACDTVYVCPAIVSVPVRGLVDVFAAMLKLTAPLPVPLAPPVTVIQPALLVADQPQLEPAVTVVLPVPPLDATLCDVGEMLKLHATAAACVTV